MLEYIFIRIYCIIYCIIAYMLITGLFIYVLRIFTYVCICIYIVCIYTISFAYYIIYIKLEVSYLGPRHSFQEGYKCVCLDSLICAKQTLPTVLIIITTTVIIMTQHKLLLLLCLQLHTHPQSVIHKKVSQYVELFYFISLLHYY